MFDPYYKWLGIPPQDQPPNHYRLLGISLFEADLDVIDAATNRQMVYIRSCATGPHAQESQKLLNEISAARRCLLNVEKKQAYDQDLRATLATDPARTKTSPSTGSAPVASAPEVTDDEADEEAGVSDRPAWLIPAAAAFGLCVLAIVGAVIYSNTRSKPRPELAGVAESSATSDHASTTAPPTKSDSKPQSADQSTPPATSDSSSSNAQMSLDKSDKTATAPKEMGLANSDARNSPGTQNATSTPEQTDTTPRPVAQLTSEPAKSAAVSVPADSTTSAPLLAVPTAAEHEAAVNTIHQLFQAEYEKVKQPAEKLAFAEKLLREGNANESEPPSHYALLSEARDMAADAGSISLSFDAIETLQKRFAIDSWEMKTEAVTRALKAPRATELAGSHAALISQLQDEAVAADNFEVANRLSSSLLSVAKKTGNADIQKLAPLRAKQVEQLETAFRETADARQTLQNRPEDPSANLRVGKYRCLWKGEWEAGLPLLARSDDATLKSLATADQSDSNEAAAKTAIGDRWWELAEKETDLPKENCLVRAQHWYEQSVSELTGLNKLKVEQRLKEISSATSNTARTFAMVAASKATDSGSTTPRRPAHVPKDAMYWNKHWYWFSKEQVSYEDAFRLAAKQKGRLVTIETEAENDFLTGNILGHTWLGMLKIKNVWVSTLGKQQAYFNWDFRQPSGGRGEKYAGMLRGGKWHDFLADKLYYCIEWGK